MVFLLLQKYRKHHKIDKVFRWEVYVLWGNAQGICYVSQTNSYQTHSSFCNLQGKNSYPSCTVLPLVSSKIFWCINFLKNWSWELVPNDRMCKRLHLCLWEVIKNAEYEIFGHLSSLYVLEFSDRKCSLFLLLFFISSIFLWNWHIWKCNQTFEIKSHVVKR